MMNRMAAFGVLALFVVIGAAGCGESGPALAPTTGTVLYNGNPLEGASVSFLPADVGQAGAGVTDSQGKFTIKTFDKLGAVIGAHKVAVTKIEGGGPGALTGEEAKKATMQMTDPAKMMQMATEKKWLIPEKYGSPATSGLTAEVKGGQPNDFKFELTD